MSDGSEWPIERIREAYGEILQAFSELFPLHPRTTMKREDETEGFSQGDESFLDAFRVKAKKVAPKIKEAADQSGNPVTWRRGDPLDSLNPAMRERIERPLKFGV